MMGEFKGTKGKWYYSTGTQSIWHPEKIGYRLAVTDIQVDKHGKQTIEAEANALLISKAPEMLEMLEKSIEVIEWYMENALPDSNHSDFFNIGANQIEASKQLIKEATTI